MAAWQHGSMAACQYGNTAAWQSVSYKTTPAVGWGLLVLLFCCILARKHPVTNVRTRACRRVHHNPGPPVLFSGPSCYYQHAASIVLERPPRKKKSTLRPSPLVYRTTVPFGEKNSVAKWTMCIFVIFPLFHVIFTAYQPAIPGKPPATWTLRSAERTTTRPARSPTSQTSVHQPLFSLQRSLTTPVGPAPVLELQTAPWDGIKKIRGLA